MHGTSARLLRLLSLLQTRRAWTGPDLAERLSVTVRTLRRDVDRLREVGYEVSSASGPGGGYVFGDGSAMPPLLLGDEEAVTVAVALRAAVESDDPLGEQLLVVLSKLEPLMSERLRARVAALRSQTVAVGWTGHRVDTTLLVTLAAACRDSEAVRVRYRSLGRNAAERVLYPLRLAHTGTRRWYLVAWDTGHGSWRTFRLDRIEGIVAVGPRVARPDPPEDVARYVTHAITAAPYPCRARVRPADGATIPSWLGTVDADGTLEVGAPTWDAVVGQLVLIGPFTVVDGPELATRLAVVADRLRAAAPETLPGSG